MSKAGDGGAAGDGAAPPSPATDKAGDGARPAAGCWQVAACRFRVCSSGPRGSGSPQVGTGCWPRNPLHRLGRPRRPQSSPSRPTGAGSGVSGRSFGLDLENPCHPAAGWAPPPPPLPVGQAGAGAELGYSPAAIGCLRRTGVC